MTVSDTTEMVAGMNPVLCPGSYMFCSTQDEEFTRAALATAVCWFREPEGNSLVLPFDDALALGLPDEWPTMRMIRLDVQSSLVGVGLTAAVSSRLAEHRIACNVVAATVHDYLFVPDADAERALELLRQLQAEAGA